MPAPMIAPIPSVIRLRGPSARFSWCSPAASASARRVWIDLVAHKFMRDSIQRGDESTVQTAPTFPGASDLSIEWKEQSDETRTLQTVIRGFARDDDVMWMRFTQPRSRDPNELGFGAQRSDIAYPA